MQTLALAVDDLKPREIAATLTTDELKAGELERRLTTMPVRMSDAELLESAKARLNRCVFVGLTERFEESLESLVTRFAWKDVPRGLVLNSAPYTTPKRAGSELDSAPTRISRSALDSEASELLHDLTRLDRALYAYAEKQLLTTPGAQLR